MIKQLITHIKWLMLLSLLTSTLYAAIEGQNTADDIKSITGSSSLTKGQNVTLSIDYVSNEERTIAVYFQTLNPKKMQFYKRITVQAGDEIEEVSFTVSDDLPSNGTGRYKAYIAPKGGKWKDRLDYATQSDVQIEGQNTADDIKSITGPSSLTKGQNVTLSIDYVSNEERTISVYFQTLNPKKMQFYKRITVQAGDEIEEVNFTVSDDLPSNGTGRYKAYIAPKGGKWKDRLDYATQSDVQIVDGANENGVQIVELENENSVQIVEGENENPALSREALIQLIKNWATDPSQANENVIIHANTSEIKDMRAVFYVIFDGKSGFLYHGLSKTALNELAGFNLHIGNWDVSSVTDMSEMFSHASKFNQYIGNWDVSNVTNMSGMFGYAQVFNQDISAWDVSNVTNMSGMFGYGDFNKDIDHCDVSNVTNMSYMFVFADFNQNISGWDVSNVTNHNSFSTELPPEYMPQFP